MDIVKHLRAGEPCQNDMCRVMDADSGCLCAMAADTIEGRRAESEYLAAQLEKARKALIDIANSDDIDNALDPERNKRVARAALAPPPSVHGDER